VTLSKNAGGTFEGLFRRKGMKPLHLSLRTTKKVEARERHDAVAVVVRQGRAELIDQLRAGAISIERVTAMVRHGESLAPVVATSVAKSFGTVDQCAKRYVAWLKEHPNRRDRTTVNAGFQLQPFQDFQYEGKRLGNLPVELVSTEMFLAYQRSYIDAKRSPNSTTVYMGRAAGLWNYLEAEEARESRRQQRPPRPVYAPFDPEMLFREKRARDRVLTQAEIGRLFDATPRPLLFPIAAGLMAGLRQGEVIHLRPGLDVDLDIGLLSVREQADWKPKTPRSKRVVPMTDQLRALAKEHVARYASDGWMVPGPNDGSAAMLHLTFRNHFKAIVERAGIEYGRGKATGVTFHTLRHTFASLAVMGGVDLYTVSQLLGNSLKMVETTYAHLSPDFKRAAIARVAAAIKLPNPDETIQGGIQE
jgi:integrase